MKATESQFQIYHTQKNKKKQQQDHIRQVRFFHKHINGQIMIWNWEKVQSVSQFSHSVMSDSLHPMDCSMLGFPVHHQIPKFAQTHIHQVSDGSNLLILHHPLFRLPSILPSIGVFSNETVLHIRWPKYWSFSFSIIPSKEHPGLISFRMDWLYLLAVQGTLKSLLQHHSSKASSLRCSAFFIV